MIQKMSDQHKISFLENSESKEIKKTESVVKKTIEQVAEEQKAKKINHYDDGLKTLHSVSSAVTGEITDIGSPSKFIKSENSNTIWENDRLQKAFQEIDNKTKTIKEKEEIAFNRRTAEQKRMDDLVETLKTTNQAKSSGVFLNGTLSGSNYKVPKQNMSIFDNKDFQRLSEKTEGEIISDDINFKKAQKDESWKNGGRVISSREINKKLIDSLFT